MKQIESVVQPDGQTKVVTKGFVSQLNGRIISNNRPDMRGGEFINFGYGTSILANDGHLLTVEAVQNIYQNLDGIQLERDWTLWVSWSKAW